MNKELEIERNKELVEKYPFLLPRNAFSGEVDKDYDYTYTMLDEMPEGWRIAFGEAMCKEILECLTKENCLEKFRITQIKEKYGYLCFYTNFHTDELRKIINKYENQSIRTCIHCGKPATKITLGWISPFCDECIFKSEEGEEYKNVSIEEYLKETED